MRKAVWLLLTMAFLVRPVEAQDGYKYYMDLCERSKRAGDYGGMEAAIQQALRYGRGDEYAWRSLAWAQARQGKWNASLENARRNIQRNGATGWALAQFADSALGYGDFANASNALAQANPLPMDDKPFEISQPVGHGWAEVYINGIGWVPVEPTDADSLRQFTISRAYLSLGASNRPPDHHYFSGSIKHGGEEFRVASIQHCLEIHGRLLGIDAPKADKRSKLRGLKPK